jgi:hypothetical protein
MASRPEMSILVSPETGSVTVPTDDQQLGRAIGTFLYRAVRTLVIGIGGGLVLAWVSALFQVYGGLMP